jgi:hypothetical protein
MSEGARPSVLKGGYGLAGCDKAMGPIPPHPPPSPYKPPPSPPLPPAPPPPPLPPQPPPQPPVPPHPPGKPPGWHAPPPPLSAGARAKLLVEQARDFFTPTSPLSFTTLNEFVTGKDKVRNILGSALLFLLLMMCLLYKLLKWLLDDLNDGMPRSPLPAPTRLASRPHTSAPRLSPSPQPHPSAPSRPHTPAPLTPAPLTSASPSSPPPAISSSRHLLLPPSPPPAISSSRHLLLPPSPPPAISSSRHARSRLPLLLLLTRAPRPMARQR